MECRQVQDWLLDAEDPRPEACGCAPVAGHLQSCEACRALAGRLAALERLWRSLPAPPEAERTKAVFLERLREPVVARARPPRSVSRRRLLQWCAASAAGLLAVGGGGWLLLMQREAQAADDLVDRLVDWNLRLTCAESEDERSRIYAEQAEQLRLALDQARLSPDQAEIAEELLRNGAWLVVTHDPVVEADRFDTLADRLLQLARAAESAGNHKRMNRLIRQYSRLLESGIDLNVERAETQKTLDFDHQRKLERLALSDADHMRQLASLLETTPDASRKEIQRALGIHGKHARKPVRAKHPHRAPEAKERPDGKQE